MIKLKSCILEAFQALPQMNPQCSHFKLQVTLLTRVSSPLSRIMRPTISPINPSTRRCRWLKALITTLSPVRTWAASTIGTVLLSRALDAWALRVGSSTAKESRRNQRRKISITRTRLRNRTTLPRLWAILRNLISKWILHLGTAMCNTLVRFWKVN